MDYCHWQPLGSRGDPLLRLAPLQSALQWYLGPTKDRANLDATERKDLVQGLTSVVQAAAFFLTGVAAFFGLFFTWRNLRQTREHTEKQLEQARTSTREQLDQLRQPTGSSAPGSTGTDAS